MSQVPPPPPPPPPGGPGGSGGWAPPPPPGGGGPVGPGGPGGPGGWAPPPVPSGSGGGAGDVVGYAWRKFQQYAAPLIAIIAVVVVVQILVSIVSSSAGNLFARFLVQIGGYVVGQILAIGIYNAALMVTAGQKPEPGLVFRTDRLGDFIVASLLTGVIVFVGMVLCILPGLAAAVLLSFAPYFVLDANRSGTDALRDSFNLVKDNLGDVIVVLILAFVLLLAGALLCGVGLLVTAPMAAIMVAATYKRLTGQPIAP